MLEASVRYYVSAMADSPEHRSEDLELGERMLEISKEKVYDHGCSEVSLLVFGQNEEAVALYGRKGFGGIDRASVIPHESIRYTCEVLLILDTMRKVVVLPAGVTHM